MFKRCVGLGWLLLWGACGLPTPEVSVVEPVGRSPLEKTFDEAARAYQVPVEVLKAIAWVESRVSPPRGPSLTGGVGLMQLSTRPDWNMLRRASELTGVDEETLKTSEEANLLGAAAVLRELFDQSLRQYPDLKPHEMGDLFHAVSLYPGIESASLAQDYAMEVFTVVERGFEALTPEGAVQSEGVSCPWRRHAPATARQDFLAEYPHTWQWRESPNFRPGRSSYKYIVIHTTQGAYTGAISWFQNTASQASSHYVVRSSDGRITQMVEHEDTAWHAGCYNPRSIGIEHEGFVDKPELWYTDAMYEESARLTRWIADRHGIPKDRSHIIGHVEIAPECNKNRHHDPGAGWNWTRFMGLVLGTEPAAGTGKVAGIVYGEGNARKRLAGVTVTCNGNTQVTQEDGTFTFILAPGPHTLELSKTGFQKRSVPVVATETSTQWNSIELYPEQMGKWAGIVYEFDFLKPVDRSTPLANATVTVAGRQIQTSATGYFEVTLPAGTYTARATHPSYFEQSVTRRVTANEKVWGSIGLVSASSTAPRPISLELSEPANGSEHDVALQRVKGTVSDTRRDVSFVQVRMNQGAWAQVPVVDGVFEVPIKLSPGENVFEVSAQSELGPTATTVASMRFQSGLLGQVYDTDVDTSQLEGATVELVHPQTGATQAMVRTDAQGRFQLVPPTVPSTYRLLVRKDGYLTSSETIDIPDDRRLQVRLPLTPGELPPPGALAIEWVGLLPDSVVSAPTLEVTGTVIGMQPVSVQVNGEPAELLAAGGFTATVPLAEGKNEILATARGAEGETVTSRLSVRRPRETPAPGYASGCASTQGSWPFVGWVLLPLLWRRPRKPSAHHHSGHC